MAVFSTFILNLEKFASSHIKAEQWERKVNLGSPIEVSRPSKTLPTRFPILVQVHWRQSPEEDFCASGLLREHSLEQPVRVMSGDSREAGSVGAWLCLPGPRGSSGAWVAPSERKGPGVCGLDSQVTRGTHSPPPAFLPEGISLEQGVAGKGLWVGTAVSTTVTPAPILTPSHLLFWCPSRPHVSFLCSRADSTLQTPRAHSALSAFAHSLPLCWTVFSSALNVCSFSSLMCHLKCHLLRLSPFSLCSDPCSLSRGCRPVLLSSRPPLWDYLISCVSASHTCELHDIKGLVHLLHYCIPCA